MFAFCGADMGIYSKPTQTTLGLFVWVTMYKILLYLYVMSLYSKKTGLSTHSVRLGAQQYALEHP